MFFVTFRSITSRACLSIASGTLDAALSRWIPVALLLFIGATVGALGWFGVLAIVALSYYTICLVRPAEGLAWAFAALILAGPTFSVAGVHIHPFELLVWPACLMFFASRIARQHLLSPDDLQTLAPLLVVGGYLVIACLLQWGDTAPLEIRMWGSSLLFGVACYLIGTDTAFQRHYRSAFVFSALALCGLALSQHFLGGPAYQGFQEPRDLLELLFTGKAEPVRLANLTFDHFNSAGAYLTIVVGVLVGFLLSSHRTPATLLATLAALLALYLTYSRGAAMATAVGIVAATYWVLTPRRRLQFVAAAIILVAVAGLALVPILMSTQYTATVALGSRALIWQAYFQAWRSSPLFGLGPGNGYATAQFLSPFGDEYAAHNNYLYLAADYGLIGVLVLLAGIAIVLRRVSRIAPAERRDYPYTLGAIAVVFAFLVHGVVDHTLVIFSYRIALFGVLGVALSAHHEKRA
jgi:O-antigen ligase